MDEIDGVANLKDDLLHSPIIPCKWVPPFGNVGPQIAPSIVVQNQEHLFAVGDEKPFVEGDDVWVGGNKIVVIYLTNGVAESVVNIVGGWNAR